MEPTEPSKNIVRLSVRAMTDPAFESVTRGPWTFLTAPGWDTAEALNTLERLPYLLGKSAVPLLPPGRHRLDRLPLPLGPGGSPVDAVVKTYGLQAAWRDRLALRNGSKARRAFLNALRLRAAGVGTPTPIAVAERWEGARLRESRFLSLYLPGLTDFRAELNRLYAEAPFCTPLMDLLQCVADAVRAFHNAGLLHRDLGNQNIALRRAPPGASAPWEVFFLDLNRARPVETPSDAQRGADLARLDLPSDFRRVFFAMLHHGYAPPPAFSAAERRARAAFDRHTFWRPFRHPFREAKLRRAERRAAHRPGTPLAPPRGRDIWIWDDRSAQPVPAYTSRDRRRWLPAANLTAALRSAILRGPAIQREYKKLLATSFQSPVPFTDTIGIALDPSPSTWALQLRHLKTLQGPHPIPLLLRLHHHQTFDVWQWTLDQALALHRQGHSITLALLQDRCAITDPKGWRQMVTLAFDRAHAFADAFEIGHAVNRSKWGIWDYSELEHLLLPVRASRIQYPEARVLGPACIDFEPHALGGILSRIAAPLPYTSLSHHLYVDRRGAPENRQGAFDTVAKCALLRAFARAYHFPDDRLHLTEVNWPLAGTGPWSPVTSPYETRDPRRNDPSVGEDDYAAFMTRYLLLTLASGHVARVHWWRLTARGFGLIDDTDPAAWRPRPAFHALQTLLSRTAGATFLHRLDTPPDTFALEFSDSTGRPFTVRWTLTTPPEYTTP